MKISRFILFVNLFIAILLSAYFYLIFDYQKKEFENIVINQIKSELTEIRYIFEKVLNKNNDIALLKPLLDRKIASSSLNRAYIIKQKDKIIKSGDFNAKIPSNDSIKFNVLNLKFKDILNKKAIETKINYYSKNKEKNLNLYYFVNKNYINQELFLLKAKYIVFYLLLLAALMYFTYFVNKKYIVKPLSVLKDYSLQKISKPKDFYVTEFNEIKEAISQTFLKLHKTIDNLYKSAITDSLTRLANRRKLKEYVKELIGQIEGEFAVIYLDLDNFKEINDYFGHSVGDEVIIKIADILKKYTYKCELTSRVGGDEFVLIWKKYLNKGELTYRMKELLKHISEHISIGELTLNVTASMGVSIYPYDAETFDELLRKADIALREAKRKKNSIVFFNTELDKKIQKKIKIKNELPKALENNEFKLYFQPKVDKNEKVVSCETLIRWQKLDGSIVPPGEFIEIAEKSGFIVELGKWVMKESFKILNEWAKDEDLKNISLAFNVSFEQIKSNTFLKDLKAFIYEFNPPLSKVEVEFTESVFLENAKKIDSIIEYLHNNGIKINLDDFGTGYSSIAFLKRYDIDVIKIDKTFVDDVLDIKGRKYVKAIVDMAKALNKSLVAEGVETKEQFEVLKKMDVDMYQGYLFAKPLPKEDFVKFVKSNLKT